MKFFILLMLIACGKHEEPVAVDLRDSDGDQIQNYKEGELEKYIAGFDRLEKISGVIKFTTNKNEEISFSNESDLKKDTLQLVTGDDTSLMRDQFFSEWSELKLALGGKTILAAADLNKVYIEFNATTVKPSELVLVDGKLEKQLGEWSDFMRLRLTKDELNGLLNGKMQLALRKKFPKAQFYLNDSDETIRVKTYKVHTYDGHKSKVLYVSKELPIEKLLGFLKIDKFTEVSDEDLFFDSKDLSGKQWFLREYANGNKAIAFYTLQDLKEEFRNKFARNKVKLERINGTPVSSLNLNNAANSKIYLIIRPRLTKRTFKEYTEVTSHRTGSASQGSDERWSCTHYKRRIETEVETNPAIGDFFFNLNEKFSNDEIKWTEQIDEKGIFWEIMLTTNVANLTFSLQGLNSSTFTTTGEHYVDCGYQGKRSTAATPTNFEGKLSFEIESFVEKFK
jgi:hypothetical protein